MSSNFLWIYRQVKSLISGESDHQLLFYGRIVIWISERTAFRTGIPFKWKPTEICWYQSLDLFLPFFEYKRRSKFVFYTHIPYVSPSLSLAPSQACKQTLLLRAHSYLRTVHPYDCCNNAIYNNYITLNALNIQRTLNSYLRRIETIVLFNSSFN